MRKINIARFVKELSTAEAYLPEDKGKGFKYVYDNIYTPFMNSILVHINGVDFGAFSLEDIVDMTNEYNEKFYERMQFNEMLIRKFKEHKAMPIKINFV